MPEHVALKLSAVYFFLPSLLALSCKRESPIPLLYIKVDTVSPNPVMIGGLLLTRPKVNP